MSRRLFLRSLLGAIAAAPLARVSSAAPKTGVLIQESPLAGFQYHAGEALWNRLREGDILTLTREPENPHDPRAVRVNWQGHKLGYVPRMENTAVSQMLDRGQALEVRIARLKQDTDPWQRVRIAVSTIV